MGSFHSLPYLIKTPFSDNYVHRLIQNKGDGKLVEVEGHEVMEEKVDSLTLEVCYYSPFLKTGAIYSKPIF